MEAANSSTLEALGTLTQSIPDWIERLESLKAIIFSQPLDSAEAGDGTNYGSFKAQAPRIPHEANSESGLLDYLNRVPKNASEDLAKEFSSLRDVLREAGRKRRQLEKPVHELENNKSSNTQSASKNPAIVSTGARNRCYELDKGLQWCHHEVVSPKLPYDKIESIERKLIGMERVAREEIVRLQISSGVSAGLPRSIEDMVVPGASSIAYMGFNIWAGEKQLGRSSHETKRPSIPWDTAEYVSADNSLPQSPNLNLQTSTDKPKTTKVEALETLSESIPEWIEKLDGIKTQITRHYAELDKFLAEPMKHDSSSNAPGIIGTENVADKKTRNSLDSNVNS